MLNRRTLMTAAGAAAGLGLASTGAYAETRAETPAETAAPAMADLADILTRTGAPAVAGAVIGPEGLIANPAAGIRRVGAEDEVTDRDLWHIGSNTKAMTAALYGLLVDQGKAGWETPLAKLFPAVAADPAFETITISQMMGHRAGILDAPVMQGGFLLQAHQDKRPPQVQRRELAARVLSAPPAGPVGEFAYGNLNYILAGAAIEAITGEAWEDAITTRLFKPLGMTTAGFGAPTGSNPWGHQPPLAEGGALIAVDPAGLADNPAVLGPAGRVHLSAGDYARFLRLFLTDGGGVLKPQTLARLTTPLPGPGQGYAMGWGVLQPPWGQGPVFVHEGSNTLWHTVTLVAPGRNLAMVGFCNAGPEASKGAARLLAGALRRQYAPD
jgi:D-alanyl-D-alanine carboxypeptidase